jgi:hypothetical protein
MDMATDCVINLIQTDHGDKVNDLDLSTQLGGQIIINWEQTVYVISKLFNFDPRGM